MQSAGAIYKVLTLPKQFSPTSWDHCTRNVFWWTELKQLLATIGELVWRTALQMQMVRTYIPKPFSTCTTIGCYQAMFNVIGLQSPSELPARLRFWRTIMARTYNWKIVGLIFLYQSFLILSLFIPNHLPVQNCWYSSLFVSAISLRHSKTSTVHFTVISVLPAIPFTLYWIPGIS